jgi:hypothetical protein
MSIVLPIGELEAGSIAGYTDLMGKQHEVVYPLKH